jgi:type I restriction enzyme S subunit
MDMHLQNSLPLGRPPTGWRVARLGDITTKIGSGATPRGGDKVYTQTGISFIRSQNVYDNRFEIAGLAHIDDEQAALLSNVEVRSKDVLINITGDSIARCCLVPEYVLPARVNQHVSIIRPSTSLDSIFLQKYLCEPNVKEYVIGHDAGGTRKALTKGHIESFLIPLPPLPEQKAIASILGSLDDKIELNRRMNETLEGMARAIFKSWFVDFDPVWAKKRGQNPVGMDNVTAALFPNDFEDSKLGKIPKGWIITCIGDQCNVVRGLSYKGEFLSKAGEGLPMHNLNSVYEGGGYKNEGLKWYSGPYREDNLIHAGDVIVTNTEQGFEYLLIGYAAIVPKRFGDEGLFSHHIYRLRPKCGSYLPPSFVYQLLRTPRFHEVIAGYTNGTTVNMLPLDGLQKPSFVLPPQSVVDRCSQLLQTIVSRVESMYDENATLSKLRDTLLPKLMSGKIRVKDAEKFTERSF